MRAVEEWGPGKGSVLGHRVRESPWTGDLRNKTRLRNIFIILTLKIILIIFD